MITLIRGGGDLASGVALRLFRSGFHIVILELPKPLAVRRMVSFGEAVYSGQVNVEGVVGRLAVDYPSSVEILERGEIPVIVDPEAKALDYFTPKVLIDARMTKKPPEIGKSAAQLVIGLGPGFVAGDSCHAVIETNRGHRLGRVIWEGAAQADTGMPDSVADHRAERVLRAPNNGILKTHVEICEHLEDGDLIADVDRIPIRAPFKGVLRGLLHDGMYVQRGLKIGDLDPRGEASHCRLVSDKSLAIGGGVLETILSREDLRPYLWREDEISSSPEG